MAFGDTGVLDNFNRADGGLGTDWTTGGILSSSSYDPAIVSNQVTAGTNSQFNSAYWNASVTSSADCEAFMDAPTLTSVSLYISARMVAPGTSGGDGYTVRVRHSLDVYYLYRIDNTVGTQLGASLSEEAGSDQGLGISCNGSTIYGYVKRSGSWSSNFNRSDSAYSAAGYIGFDVYDTTVRIDNFGGGPFGGDPEGSLIGGKLLRGGLLTHGVLVRG